MIVKSYRQPPPPGALDRFAVNLRPNPLGFTRGRRARRRSAAAAQAGTVLPAAGSDTAEVVLTEAAAAVKEYADVSAYRNILDMLNTFEGVLNRWGRALANELCCVERQSRMRTAIANPPAGYGNGGIRIGTAYLQLTRAIGYAAGKIGPKNKDEAHLYAQQMVKAAGLTCAGGAGFFEVPDLLNLARTINYEMNRVRLPIPHNFRQVANAIQGRDYRLCPKWHNQMPNLPQKPSLQQWKYGGVRTRYFQRLDEIFSANYVNAVELLQVYIDLKKSIAAMRVGVRKEIDAANVAAKVQEQTIRREQEELISRQQAAEQARKREIEILEEKRRAYEAELAEAERIKDEMAKTKAELAAEMEQLQAARQSAQTEEEVQAVEEQAAEVITAAQLADQMEQDMAANLQTSARAASNLNQQVRAIQAETVEAQHLAEEAGIPTKKPMNLTPIILTAAAGLLLT